MPQETERKPSRSLAKQTRESMTSTGDIVESQEHFFFKHSIQETKPEISGVSVTKSAAPDSF